MYGEIIYDETGQPLVQNFKDYLVPTAVEVPHFVLDHTITPNPFAPGGFKGAGETGAVSPPPCLINAVEDALSPFGIGIRTLPLKPNLVWEAIRSTTHSPSDVAARRVKKMKKVPSSNLGDLSDLAGAWSEGVFGFTTKE